MVIGMGCDIVRIERFTKWLDKDILLNRYFTSSEIKHVNNSKNNTQRMIEKLAGMFASKEAFKKAVGTNGVEAICLKDIIVEKNKNGAPRLRLERRAAKAMVFCSAQYVHVSISHEKEYCVAMVIIGR